jgi:hypothetical protein
LIPNNPDRVLCLVLGGVSPKDYLETRVPRSVGDFWKISSNHVFCAYGYREGLKEHIEGGVSLEKGEKIKKGKKCTKKYTCNTFSYKVMPLCVGLPNHYPFTHPVDCIFYVLTQKLLETDTERPSWFSKTAQPDKNCHSNLVVWLHS